MADVSTYDIVGLIGVVLMLIAYGATVAGELDVQAWPALAANFVGASLVLVSLSHDFNLSAAVIEGAWAVIALGGLIRLYWRSVRSRTGTESQRMR